MLGLHRTDYLINAVHDAPLGILQVEINTIAAGCDGLQAQMNDFHEYENYFIIDHLLHFCLIDLYNNDLIVTKHTMLSSFV